MWQRFTEDARKVVFYAQEEAGRLGENHVGAGHFLLGLLRGFGEAHGTSLEEPSVAVVLLEQLDVNLAALYAETKAACGRGDAPLGQDMQLTPRAKRVIDLAYEEAKQFKHGYIGTEHLLLGLLRETDGTTAVLNRFGVTLDAVRRKLPELLADKSSKEQLLTLDEAVKFLGTSKPTLYRLLGQDEINGLKVGRQWRFRKADLVAYMERGSSAPASAAATAVPALPREDLEKALAFLNREMEYSDAQVNDDETLLPGLLARQIIVGALKAEAGAVHLEPDAEGLRVRYRAGSELREALHLPVSLRGPVLTEYKMLAGLNVSEPQKPQDGRMSITHEDRAYDIHVSTLPTVGGEAAALHISDSATARLGLGDLGLMPEDFQTIYRLIQEAKGIVLATGPAGSGRTTLLYACLSEVAGAEKKTLTIEDPVLFPLPYVTQMQVNPSAGLTIAAMLRAFGRQDPDIILAASLGDLETVGLAMDAALSGKLVLAAQEANTAVSALTRLLELGAKPPLLAATVTGIVALRLARKVCQACKQPVDVSTAPVLKALLSQAAEGGCQVPAGTVFFGAVGCEQCRGQGYKGETGLYEVLTMTELLAEAVLRRAPAEELAAIAVSSGMRTLPADGVRKAAAGQTTLEEVLRVTS